MQITIDTSNTIPVYEQIIEQIQQGVLSGKLKTGSPLPSIRQLADDLEINPNTVAKAYQFLERSHVIETAGRRGTMVRKDASVNIDRHLELEVTHKMSDLCSDFLKSGIEKDKLRKILAEVLSKL